MRRLLFPVSFVAVSAALVLALGGAPAVRAEVATGGGGRGEEVGEASEWTSRPVTAGRHGGDPGGGRDGGRRTACTRGSGQAGGAYGTWGGRQGRAEKESPANRTSATMPTGISEPMGGW